jgi:hypothetical protein
MNEKQNIKMQFASVRKLLVGVFLMAGFFSLGYYFGIKGYTVQNDGYPKVTINRSLPEAQKDLDFALFCKL